MKNFLSLLDNPSFLILKSTRFMDKFSFHLQKMGRIALIHLPVVLITLIFRRIDFNVLIWCLNTTIILIDFFNPIIARIRRDPVTTQKEGFWSPLRYFCQKRHLLECFNLECSNFHFYLSKSHYSFRMLMSP